MFECVSQADDNETLDCCLKIRALASFRAFQRKDGFRSIFIYFLLMVFVAFWQENISLGMIHVQKLV